MKEQFFKKSLLDIYFDWVNNFVSSMRMAEYYDIDHEILSKVLEAAIALYHKKYMMK